MEAEEKMPPIIQTKAVMYTVKDLLHTLKSPGGGAGRARRSPESGCIFWGSAAAG